MNWETWDVIDKMLVSSNVRPILAVIPDNKDPKLMIEPPVNDFWDRVREWQARGWAIALHGYQHEYVNKNAGVIGLTRHSEFAGLPREVQKRKLLLGLDIFKRENVRADCWVAPSHSFDWTTVELLAELGVDVISDGLWPWPYTDKRGVIWVPQQIWGGRKPNQRGGLCSMPAGVWTVCHHHNIWGKRELKNFQASLEEFGPDMIGLDDAVKIGKDHVLAPSDRFRAWQDFTWNHRIRPALSRIKRSIRK
jgi:hypothetical protein